MATNLFNYTNQRLNAERLREIEAFNSNNFGGILNDSSPFSVDGNTVTLNPTIILGGGVLLYQDSPVSCNLNVNNTLWYLEVVLDDSVANITTNELIGKINFRSVVCDTINKRDNYIYYSPIVSAAGKPNTSGYYEYDDETGTFTLSADTEIDSSKIYYMKLEANSIVFKSTATGPYVFSYLGNTLWISDNTFIIPIYANINNELVQTVVVKSKNDLESLLSLDAYSRLKSFCEGTFVWSSGGTDEVIAPDGTIHKKGDIGSLNVTGDTISNNNINSPVKVQNLTINNLAGANSINTKLVVDNDGNITAKQDYILPVGFGGTGSSNKKEAKSNLGIFYGTQFPPSGTFNEGDIYLWIIE